MSKELILTKGKVAIVDDEDFEYLKQWKWSLHSKGYAVRREYLGVAGGKEISNYILLHRLLTGAKKGQDVDHINHDKLDNRRENIRLCDRSENNANMKKRKDNTSGARGVYWYKAYKKWVVNVTFRGKNHHIGYFVDKSDAIRAQQQASIEIHGEFANVHI